MPMFGDQITDYTWATKPSVAPLDEIICITDVARGGSLWRGDGTNWLPVGGLILLGSSATSSSVTGTTSTTTLATIALPAGIMGANGQIRLTTLWSAGTVNANAKNLIVKFDAATYQSASLTSLSAQTLVHIRNRNSAASQVGWTGSTSSFGTSSSPVITSAIDTSVAKNILIQAQLTNISDTLTLESYTLELLR